MFNGVSGLNAGSIFPDGGAATTDNDAQKINAKISAQRVRDRKEEGVMALTR
jgi:hypothetical protein